jgi:putative peptide zinc metalloprotease protein
VKLRIPHRRPVQAAVAGAITVGVVGLGIGAYAVDGALSSGNGGSSSAVAVNTKDGTTKYAIALKVVPVTTGTVTSGNAAVAVNAGCTDCSSVAISFDGLVVWGSPSAVVPTNIAWSENIDCIDCTAVTDALQVVTGTGGMAMVTGEGRRQIAAIRVDLESLRTEDLTLDQLTARVQADEQAFVGVLHNDVFPIGPPQASTSASTDPAATTAPSDTASAPADAGTMPTTDSPAPTDPTTSPAPTASDTSTPAPTAS